MSSHEAFSERHGFKFPLLADTDKKVADLYGTVGPLGFPRRSVFVVNPEGVITYAHRAIAGLTFRPVEELVAAVAAAGLVETLQSEGPFTVFAPTNDAFAALPAGLVDKLLLPENKDLLVKILTYHVVSGTVLAADVTAGDVPTVEGQNITITTDMGVKVNGATVTATDIIASNGVIHVIDAVILPPDVDPSAL
jgi:uncharacterized surface protein with fasciclin (FAS1) repeats